MTDRNERYDDVDVDRAEGDVPDGFGTFDDYRRSRRRERAAEAVTTVILGQEVTLPTELPIGFDLRLHELSRDGVSEGRAVELMQELVELLYGDDALAEWGDELDAEDLQILIIWGAANVRSPHSMTFAEAAKAAQAAEGKARKVGSRRPRVRGSSRR